MVYVVNGVTDFTEGVVQILESFVTHFVAFVFGIIVGVLLQKKSQ